MVRHCVLFRFTETTTAEDVERIGTAAGELPARIPSIKAYAFGPDLRLGGVRGTSPSSVTSRTPMAGPRTTPIRITSGSVRT